MLVNVCVNLWFYECLSDKEWWCVRMYIAKEGVDICFCVYKCLHDYVRISMEVWSCLGVYESIMGSVSSFEFVYRCLSVYVQSVCECVIVIMHAYV